MDLNPEQRAAVRHTDSPLLVLAGAGSGKTGVITEKIAHLIEGRGLPPESVVAVTFTNKAATEMRHRLSRRLDRQALRRLSISTFHRLGLRLLHQEARAAGRAPGFTIFDQGDVTAALGELIGEQQAAIEPAVALASISNWKNDFVTPDAALATAETDRDRVAALLYAGFERLLEACNAVDFDDLIVRPVRLLEQHEEIRDRWRGRIRHLLVDEYQDTNRAQYELVRQLVDRFGAFTAVGDDDQSIYSWRGARPENLSALQSDYPNLRVVKLERNYRSSQRILKAANHLIGHNPHAFEKRLWSDLGLGDELRVSICRHAIDEAEWVVADLMTRHFQSGARWGDFAILYRSNFQSRLFEQALRDKRIPYAVSGGRSFFDRPEVRDILAYLRVLVNPDDDTAFLRCVNTPRRELGPRTLTTLGAYARERGTSLFTAAHEIGLETRLEGRPLGRVRRFADWLTLTADNASRGDPVKVLRGLLDDIGYADWLGSTLDSPKQVERALENVEELIGGVERMSVDRDDQNDLPLTDVVSRLCLQDMLSRQDESEGQDVVQLTTLHAAKGLEYPHVYMVGMEEELLPHRNSTGDEAAIEEERRLCYVGITRARRTLTLTHCRSRQRHGESGSCEPSRFLEELPSDELVWLGGTSTTDEASRRDTGRRSLDGLMAMLDDP